MNESDRNKSPFKIDIDWDSDPENVDYNATFFKHFFPDLTGKAEVLDNFFDDVRAPMYALLLKTTRSSFIGQMRRTQITW